MDLFLEPSGGVIAAFGEIPHDKSKREAVAGLFEDRPNSPVAGTIVAKSYLEECKEIPEREAWIHHPRLMEKLGKERPKSTPRDRQESRPPHPG